MKSVLFSILFTMVSLFSFGQSRYQYVIIPTQFPSFAEGFNPYGISSVIQKNLNEKNINSILEADIRPADYCEVLTIGVEKIKNVFRNKVRVKLVDCKQRIVWSCEGTGESKEYREGFAQAITIALSGLTELPENTTPQYQSVARSVVPASVAASANKQVMPFVVPEVKAEPTSAPIADETTTDEEIYEPKNLFYNYTYFVDLVDAEQGGKKLVLINGKQFGYKNLQTIAVLAPSGLDDVFTIQWINADTSAVSGVANLADGKLKISLKTGSIPTIITLKSYK